MKASFVPALAGLLLMTTSAAHSADSATEFTNFRVGVSATSLDVSPGADYMPAHDDHGFGVFAEFPQSNHAASRFVIYQINNDEKDVSGFETQLMWGWGLAEEGFRLYTGPAWHREKIAIRRTGTSSHTGVFNGWGWQIGTGYQLGAITLDVAGTYRDDQDYRNENRRGGASGSRPDVWLTNAMISYRF